jgi:hypothetical protein
MLEGCGHCGTVVRRGAWTEAANCPECDRPLQRIDAFEARILARERRIAEQFQRLNRLRPAAGVRPGVRTL